MKVRFWQMWELPARHAGQVPSHSRGITVTRSPADQPSTSVPTDSTVPLISCPKTSGVRTRRSMCPWAMCRSVPQRPTNATRTCTWPAGGGAYSVVTIPTVP